MSDRGAELRRYARWTAVLDALEQDLDRAERQFSSAEEAQLLQAELPPIEEMGPLPDGLTARAMKLANRQAEVLLRGEERMTTVRRQLRVGEELRTGADTVPVYLDTTG